MHCNIQQTDPDHKAYQQTSLSNSGKTENRKPTETILIIL